jgi:3-hydroxyisobutyrate dehydrogenase
MNSNQPKPRIAFLGLGIMGGGMARRLLAAGFPLTVYNRNAEKAAPFAAEGAQIASTPREAAGNAEVVISMLSDDEASRGVWLGEDGALAGAVPGTVLIESSTVTVGWVRKLAAAAEAQQCDFLDAPVTGSKPQAAAGELSFFVGGTASVLEKAQPVLSAMSRAAIHLGPTGSGALLKLINNFLCGVQIASFAEALALIEKSGLDREKTLGILTTGTPGSPMVKTMAARMTAGEYTPNFLLRLMAKDLAYASGEGGQHTVEMATADAALGVFKRAIEAGYGERDLSAVIEPLRG